jgi:hypothetical protein
VVPRQWIQHMDWLGGCHCSRRWRAKAKRTANKGKGARSRRTKARSKGRQVLSVEVRDSPLPPLGFIDLREPRSPNRARWAH